MRSTIITAVNKVCKNKYKKAQYFFYRNKIKNSTTDYGKYKTDKEFQEHYKVTDEQMFYMKQWEQSDEYAYLMGVLLRKQSLNDIVEIYNVVRDKAKQGDIKSIKEFIDLQPVIKKLGLKEEDKPQVKQEDEPEDDGLTLE